MPVNYLMNHHRGNGHESKTQVKKKYGNIHLRVLRMQMFLALRMKNEELVDGKREPYLMKNNPSNPVISKLSSS